MFKRKNFCLCVSLLLIIFFVSQSCKKRPADIIDKNIRLTKLADIQFPPSSKWIFSGNGIPQGILAQTQKGYTSVFLDGREFLFDQVGTVLKGENSKSFVAFTPLGGEVAFDWELAFYDAAGQKTAYNDKNHGFSKITVSDMGNTVMVAGVIKEDKQVERIGYTLYKADGKEIYQKVVAENLIISAIAADEKGTRIAYVTSKNKRTAKPVWDVYVENIKGEILDKFDMAEPVQGIRFIDENDTLVLLCLGGIRFFPLGEEQKLSPLFKVPEGYYIPDAGHIYLKSDKIFVVAEQSLQESKGWHRWALFSIDLNSGKSKLIREGEEILSRKSPALSISKELGAKELPVLVTPQKLIDFELNR